MLSNFTLVFGVIGNALSNVKEVAHVRACSFPLLIYLVFPLGVLCPTDQMPQAVQHGAQRDAQCTAQRTAHGKPGVAKLCSAEPRGTTRRCSGFCERLN